jgi:hypothetical protein
VVERTLWEKFRNSVRRDSITTIVHKIVRYPAHRRRLRRLISSPSIEDRFTAIFRANFWSSSESASGLGSTLAYTENLRRHLPDLFEKFAIRSVFDAPCGDFNWMKLITDQCDIDYVGADIVKPLIDLNIKKHSTHRIRFIHANISRDPFPRTDLWLCRDCLIHLSYADTFSALQRFIDSGIPYVLTTSYKLQGGHQNHDIETGSFRQIDLFSAPYLLNSSPLYRINDTAPGFSPREMCLWSREDVLRSLAGQGRASAKKAV